MSENTKKEVSTETKKSIGQVLEPVKNYLPANKKEYVVLAEGVALGLAAFIAKAIIDARNSKKQEAKK